MKENWPYIFLVVVLSLGVIVFLFRQNMKDRRNLEKKLNEDYPRPRKDEEDPEPEEIPK
ncbi:MAG TPA: hypothetical protein VFV31_07250 [Chitinophagaceae bacterium]|nr:hypothetical protein [Chitinophagaceae bacterium]